MSLTIKNTYQVYPNKNKHKGFHIIVSSKGFSVLLGKLIYTHMDLDVVKKEIDSYLILRQN